MTETSAYLIPFKYELLPIQFLLINPRFYLARALEEERHAPTHTPPMFPVRLTAVPAKRSTIQTHCSAAFRSVFS